MAASAGWPESDRACASEELEGENETGSRHQWNLVRALGEQSDS